MIFTYLILDAITTQLNCLAIINGLMFNLCNSFDNNWFNFSNRGIQSFHNLAGAQNQQPTTNASPFVLMPVKNGPVVTCLKPNIRFLHVQCSTNFALLVTIPNAGPAILHTNYNPELL
jgi:hypothetical protein